MFCFISLYIIIQYNKQSYDIYNAFITAALVLLIETTMIAVGVTYITDYCPSIKQQPKPHYHICVFFVLPFPFFRWFFRIVIERGMHASIESIRDACIRMLFIYRTGNKSSAQYMYELYSRKRMKGNRYRRTMTTAVARMN